MATKLGLAVLVVLAVAASAATAAAPDARITADRAGDDWRLPAHVRPVPNTGFYWESARPGDGIDAISLDLTWRQIEPQPGVFDMHATAQAYNWRLSSFRRQQADPRPFWLRLFASGTPWAPTWLARECSYRTVGPDYEGMRHVPIWDPCVWSQLRAAWHWLLVEQNLRNDPRLVMVYVPGAFTYVEFDYEMIDRGVREGLTLDAYTAWHRQMVADLVAMMNGENDDPADDRAGKLVYTGEDFPYSQRFGDRVAFLARDAVAAGMGIRNGITELFNDHLGEAPAYGSHIGDDGHLHTDESWIGLDGRVIGAENECFTADCWDGTEPQDPGYLVKLSDLKALQLRANWIYAQPRARWGGTPLAGHYAWMRRELGRRVGDAPDAWVALRDAEDVYWRDRGDRRWRGFPFVRNLERWIVQRDVAPDGVVRRGTALHVGDPVPDNGRAYESLRTDRARRQTRIYLDVDDRFQGAADSAPVELKVTYRNVPGTSWRAVFRGAGAQTLVTPLVRGRVGAGRGFRTVTFTLAAPGFDGGLPGGTDIALEAVRGDLEASFVRVVKG